MKFLKNVFCLSLTPWVTVCKSACNCHFRFWVPPQVEVVVMMEVVVAVCACEWFGGAGVGVGGVEPT